jgi:uncharacterized membrane-anchored protein
MLDQIKNLPDRTRLLVMGVMTVAILGVINFEISGKERIVRDGTTMLLRIAPRDPRSLMQGDYMALRYSMANVVAMEANRRELSDGVVVVQLGNLEEASFVGLFDGQQLAAGQHLLRFRKRGESVRLASDAFFFEEGTAQMHSEARFGEIRVNESGDAVLTGLRYSTGEPIGTQLH